METKEIIITECFACRTRYQNYFKASPCCRSIVVKIDDKGNRTSITFLSAFSFPLKASGEEVISEEQPCLSGPA